MKDKQIFECIPKNLDYYMSLRYPIEIQELSNDEGGGYFVCIPQLGSSCVNGIGDTLEEALTCMISVKKDVFESLLENNIEIPEPEIDDDLKMREIKIIIPKEICYKILFTALTSNIPVDNLIASVITKYFKNKEDLITERKNKNV